MIKWICGYDQIDMWTRSNGYVDMIKLICGYDQMDVWI